MLAEHPERVMNSRWVRTWKLEDLKEGEAPKAKSRWTVAGYQDPDLLRMA